MGQKVFVCVQGLLVFSEIIVRDSNIKIRCRPIRLGVDHPFELRQSLGILFEFEQGGRHIFIWGPGDHLPEDGHSLGEAPRLNQGRGIADGILWIRGIDLVRGGEAFEALLRIAGAG